MINNWENVHKVDSLPLVVSLRSYTADNNKNAFSHKLEMTEEKVQSTLVNHSLTMSSQCGKRQTLPWKVSDQLFPVISWGLLVQY